MTALLLVSLAGWRLALRQESRRPLCWLSCDAPLAASPIEPPEGRETCDWNGFYELDFVLRNEGERALVLYDYALVYEPDGQDASAWCWMDDSAPLLSPRRVLPAGQTVRFTQRIEVWGESAPEDAFPLTVRYQTYDDDLVVGRAALAAD